MDCKELVTLLRKYAGCCTRGLSRAAIADYFEQAAASIETLLTERDAAIEDLRGMCWCCSHATPWLDAFGDERLATCEYMRSGGVLARGGGKCKCLYWEWRGPQKGAREPDSDR